MTRAELAGHWRISLKTLDDAVCIDDYPEHDFEVQDDRDGIVTLLCRRCGAESWEESAREFGADDHAR
jgi:hypothetical protein